ncbi:putative NADH-flavin reductase [Prauserella shujinwangii]|uniref:Putative NADH-flavin reductase n=1 Tax=Prauserella shujinwangii TaxID=1453103 RepID=A0A2T0LTE3_9PSEU|nr:NAD(P)H-binding protein [Prauserella shujinwangii]PRX46995.1 putative NADH-flavin reductase [Prauserella shujinwangii]
MKLTIFAATGGVGRHLLQQTRDAGHDVTAVVRNPATLPAGVRTVIADLAAADPAALQAAVAGTDGVLSCLGPRPSQRNDGITSRGTRAIIEAMHVTGARRIVVISASPIGTVPSPSRPNPPKRDPGDGFFMRYLGNRIAKRRFPEVYADLALMEDELRDSGLDWTVIRPPALTNKPLTGTYRTALGRNAGGTFISRADVAHCMLHVLERPETIQQTIGIANR